MAILSMMKMLMISVVMSTVMAMTPNRYPYREHYQPSRRIFPIGFITAIPRSGSSYRINRDKLQLKARTKRERQSSNTNTNTDKYTNAYKKTKTPVRIHSQKSIDEKTVVIIYHKPPNVITSHSNADAVPIHHNQNHNDDIPNNRLTVYQDITSMKHYIGPMPTINANDDKPTFSQITKITSKLHAIGRLDADTTGLLLLTNDGGLVHHVTNPTASSTSSSSHKITKTYQALIMGYHTLTNDHDGNEEPTSRALHQLKTQGVDIGKKYGGMTLPASSLKVLSHPTPKTTLVSITLVEGKNRQVRRMFHAVGSGVMRLCRTNIGNGYNGGGGFDLDLVGLDGQRLEEGQWRVLTDREVWDGLGWKVRTLGMDVNGNGNGTTRSAARRGSVTSSKTKRGRDGKRRQR